MSKQESIDAEPIYFHDCPVLGEHTLVPRAAFMKDDRIVATQHKCVFCSYEAGDLEECDIPVEFGTWKEEDSI